jgi:hypothetical protein
MSFVAHHCPCCGAPLPARERGAFHCAYCSTPLVPVRDGFRISESFEEELIDPQLERFWLGGARYAIDGRIGRGEASDVFLAHRDRRLSERVIVKALRSDDADLLRHEWSVLRDLQSSHARGSAHFTRLLPQPVAHGDARLGVHGNEGERTMSLFRFESGFVHRFDDVRAAYPSGVDGRAVVWIWKRILELLTFVHESGWVHGAILPRHLLVHARDHGVRFCGFACAARVDAPLAALVADATDFYPERLERATAALDIAMSARSITWLLGGDPLVAPASTPAAFAALLGSCAAMNVPGSALDVLTALDTAAREAFGPPRYVPLAMPGWNIPE